MKFNLPTQLTATAVCAAVTVGCLILADKLGLKGPWIDVAGVAIGFLAAILAVVWLPVVFRRRANPPSSPKSGDK
jgi:hypothetical protein